MANKYTKQMAQSALRNAKRRLKTMVEKHHMFVQLPELKGKAYGKFIKALEKIGVTRMTERQKTRAKKEYIRAYEHGEIEPKHKPLREYTPPTESDFYNGVDNSQVQPPEIELPDIDTLPYESDYEYEDEDAIDSAEEIESELQSLIDSVVNQTGPSLTHRDSSLGEMLRNELNNIINEFVSLKFGGDRREFYEVLSDPEYLSQLQSAAYRYLEYKSKAETDRGEQEDAKQDFIDALYNF